MSPGAGKTAFIDFFCEITPQSAQTLVSTANSALQGGADRIVVRISSCGGSLDSAFAAYHFLRSVPVPTEMCNMGNVESSAVLLYLAAATRIATPHSRFLLHPFHWTFGPGQIPLPKIAEAVASLEFDARRYAEIFSERTEKADKPVDVLQCLQGKPLVIGADVARACGITTEDPAVPATPTGAFHVWIVG